MHAYNFFSRDPLDKKGEEQGEKSKTELRVLTFLLLMLFLFNKGTFFLLSKYTTSFLITFEFFIAHRVLTLNVYQDIYRLSYILSITHHIRWPLHSHSYAISLKVGLI